MSSERLSLDTSAACFLFGRGGTHAVEQQRRESLESLITENRYELLLPAPVIAELLHGAFNKTPKEFLVKLDKLGFPVVSVRSNIGQVLSNHPPPLPTFNQLASTTQQHKEVVKTDILIIACAIGADSHLCTFDNAQANYFERFATGTGLEAGPASHFGGAQQGLDL